jgi:hypothetical protein
MQTLTGVTDTLRLEVPGEQLTVAVARGLAGAILLQGKRGLVPRRRPEVGGILLGTVKTGATTAVEVEGFLQVPCEHLFGPSYSLSETDKESLRAAVAEYAPGRRRGIRAVGFYRTHTRRGLALDDEEMGLFADLFPDRVGMALLVKPRLLRRSHAALFFRDGSSIEFPVGQVEEPPAEAEDDVRSLVKPHAAHKTPLWASWWAQVPLIAGQLFVVGLLGYAAGRQFNRMAPAAEPPRDPYALNLMVVEYGDNLFLTWDHKSVPVSAATRATLFIGDGDQERSVTLSREQLQTGAITYRKLGDHVEFRLEVFMGPRHAVTEVWQPETALRNQ